MAENSNIATRKRLVPQTKKRRTKDGDDESVLVCSEAPSFLEGVVMVALLTHEALLFAYSHREKEASHFELAQTS